MPQVQVGQLPGAVRSINVPDGSTVAQAIAAAGINTQNLQGMQVRHQGKQLGAADMGNIRVNPGDTILLTTPITGNLFTRLIRRAHQAVTIVKIERSNRK